MTRHDVVVEVGEAWLGGESFGWRCFTCRDNDLGFPDLRAANEAAEAHAARRDRS